MTGSGSDVTGSHLDSGSRFFDPMSVKKGGSGGGGRYEGEKGRKNSQRALVFTATLIYTRTHACRKKKMYFFIHFWVRNFIFDIHMCSRSNKKN